ncbi:MAG TPA: helicase-associated domain-containing protein [Anaerolineaceae bacterium]|nr:helicase-associated domain-containing protein [Anaerolineaceae bacterium]HQP08721.1 helicase-associated domain-containing protein [Anaerolineaceae bacterium]
MPDLQKSFLHYDQGMLRILAEKWDVELDLGPSRQMLSRLIPRINTPEALHGMLAMLSEDARETLLRLAAAGGMQPWAEFTRNHGSLRVMGAAKRDRERPDRSPISITEQLYYCGLIAKDFLKTEGEPQEFVFIPDDFLPILKPAPAAGSPSPGHPAVLPEKQHILPASSGLLDDACTFLAALRTGLIPGQQKNAFLNADLTFLASLLHACEMVDASSVPEPNNVRKFLESTRAESLLFLVQRWQESTSLNELRLLDHLVFEGNWVNSPQPAREFLVGMLRCVPTGIWWDLNSFIEHVKTEKPDFQRPAGDYDSWFIQRTSDGQYLRGFESWDDVDGGLIRYLITGPMHLLGLLDLAGDEPKTAYAFKWTGWADALLDNRLPAIHEPQPGHIHLNNNGMLLIDRTALRPLRYQLARFCDWLGLKENTYRYQISPAGLVNARKQGLQVSQLEALLHKHADSPLPPGILQAIQRWEKDGTTALIQSAAILRLDNPEVFEKLKRSRAGRQILEVLSPTVCTIRPGGVEAIRDALAELGYLIDF